LLQAAYQAWGVKLKKIKSESISAASAVLAIVAITFCIELLIMASMASLGYVVAPEGVIFADAALLATLSAAPIYLLVLRPIRREYEKRLQAEGLAENMSRLAITDSLTRIMNRRGITVGLLDAMAQSERYGTPLSVAMADIDHFKSVNDTHGHDSGDTVLTGIASLLAEALRMPDKVGRYGGEEFLIIFPHTALTQSRRIAERIRRTVEETDFDIGTKGLRLTLSIGLAQFQKGEDLERLLSRVDRALYAAKQQGRNRVIPSKEEVA
jgi:diguanylate cyclase (GGDEF)-like protein